MEGGGGQNEQKRKGQKRGAELFGSPLFSRDSTDSAGTRRQGQVPRNTHMQPSKQEAAHTRARLIQLLQLCTFTQSLIKSDPSV